MPVRTSLLSHVSYPGISSPGCMVLTTSQSNTTTRPSRAMTRKRVAPRARKSRPSVSLAPRTQPHTITSHLGPADLSSHCNGDFHVRYSDFSVVSTFSLTSTGILSLLPPALLHSTTQGPSDCSPGRRGRGGASELTAAFVALSSCAYFASLS